MSINPFPYQFRPTAPLVNDNGVLVRDGIDAIRTLFNRTGQGNGLPNSVGNSLAATGSSQTDALALVNDYNEVTGGSGGVALFSLQPSLVQIVFNGSGSSINVYPPIGGNIDSLGLNNPYVLANTKTQIFTSWGLQASGVPYFRSLQLG